MKYLESNNKEVHVKLWDRARAVLRRKIIKLLITHSLKGLIRYINFL